MNKVMRKRKKRKVVHAKISKTQFLFVRLPLLILGVLGGLYGMFDSLRNASGMYLVNFFIAFMVIIFSILSIKQEKISRYIVPLSGFFLITLGSYIAGAITVIVGLLMFAVYDYNK